MALVESSVPQDVNARMGTAPAVPAWSWRDILARSPLIGIPHFQRGMVWDSSNRVALLESLYQGAPCGMFVTWRPDPDSHVVDIGISVLSEKPLDAPHAIWMVDGQQRTRSLISIFRECVGAEVGSGGGLEPRRPLLVPRWVLESIRQHLPEGAQADGDIDPELEDSAPNVEETIAPANDEDVEQAPDKGQPSWFVCVPALVPRGNDEDDWWRRSAASARVVRYSPFRAFKEGALVAKRAVAPVGLLPLALFFADEDPFSPERLRGYVASLEGGDFDALQRDMPWGPLWLTGRAVRWRDVTSVPERERLLRWMRSIEAERDAAARPFSDALRRLHALFREPRFAIGELPLGDLPSAVAAYVRINRAGVRVRAEERAMAVLMRVHPPLLDALSAFLRARDERLEAAADPRAALTHASDRTFGFGLWMQVVVRYVVLAEFPRGAARWLGADLLEKPTVRQKLEFAAEKAETLTAMRERTRGAVERASRALLLLDDLLSKEVYLDHRMARPDVQQCWPFIEIFSRLSVADLDALSRSEGAREALALVLLVSMLRGAVTKAKLQDLCDAIHGVDLSAGAPPEERLGLLLRSFIRRLAEPVGGPSSPLALLRRAALERYEKLVGESRSLQHPAVGWLYAIERRGETMDFHWPRQIEAWHRSEELDKSGAEDFLCRGCRGKESVTEAAALSASMYGELGAAPEKQHIVPFSDARMILDEGGTRATASPANDIGNLTWISSIQNGLDHGFSDYWMVLDDPRDHDNLRARGFVDAADARESAAAIFERMGELVAAGRPRDAAQDFRAFCEYRRDWMKRAMAAWVYARIEHPLAASLLGEEPGAADRRDLNPNG